jgi:starch phosphorylase
MSNVELKNAIDSIDQGHFSGGDRELFRPVLDSLMDYDEYLVFADYPSYVEASERAATAYQDREHWTRMSILNVARCGFFSSDRTIRQYCDEIWKRQADPRLIANNIKLTAS